MLSKKCLLSLLMVARLMDWVIVAGQKGSGCSLSRGHGVCRLIDSCRSVYEDLLSGNPPERVCGYQGSTPIVCCPDSSGLTPPPLTELPPIWGNSSSITTWQMKTTTKTSKTTTTRRPTIPSQNPQNDRPARRMCTEYAKAVYALVESPALAADDHQLVNTTLCAIKSKKLIVGGTRSDPKEFPHMAAIGYIGPSGRVLWKCGGTLISDRYVLSAAHCAISFEWGEAKWVRTGDLVLSSSFDDARPQDRRIIKYYRHPNYKRGRSNYNDIALFQLQSSINFDAYTRPACLSLNPSVRIGEKAVATGWGLVDWDQDASDSLRKVTLPIVSYPKCREYFFDEAKLDHNVDDNTQFCAGESGKDTCQGDSGGPLAVFNDYEECMYDVIGVTSFGKSCGSVAPGIYTKVYGFLDWIEKIVWPNLS